jgi:hypothetical protein
MTCWSRFSAALFACVVATFSAFSGAAMPKQDVAVELFYDGAWHDLVDSDEVLGDTPISIVRGQGDESPAPRPSTIDLRLNNAADKFRTSNPLSALYGKAGVNTPLRVSVGGVVRGWAAASSWSCGQSSDFRASPRRGNAWTDVQGGGQLQRVNQWTHNVKSPLRVYDDATLTADVIGRWPLEDAPGATAPAGLVAGSSTTGGTEIAFGSQFRAPGTGPLVDIGGPNAGLAFNMVPVGSTAWQFSTIERLPNLEAGALPFLFDLTLADGTDIIVTFDRDNGILGFLVQTSAGVQLFYDEATIGQDLTPMRLWTVQFTQDGTNIDVGLKWRAVGDTVTSWIPGSYAGTIAPLLTAAYFGGDLPEGTTIGYVTAVADASPDLASDDRYNAFAGHPGELASVRFGRLCDENGIPYYVSDSYDTSQPMGPQGPDTLAGQFEEIEATEDALIFDHRTEGRVYMLSRGDRYNQTPALTLDATGTDHGMPALPTEVTDDLPIHNLVTAKQLGGGDYTAEDATSSMGTQDPPDGRGEYKQDVDVNVADPATGLRQQAYWWLNRGTVALPRFPTVTVDLNSLPPEKIAEVEAVDVGSVIEIVNYRENTIRLYVLGYKEPIGTHSRTIAFTCAPDQQFVVGVYDGTARYDLRTCTVKTQATSSATSITLKITQAEAWSTTSTPYDLMISGERVTVTSMAARSGSVGDYQQVATVTRAVNGIGKTLPAGAEAHIATPGRWAL